MNLKLLYLLHSRSSKIKSNKKMALMTFINIVLAVIISFVKDPMKVDYAEPFGWLHSVFMDATVFFNGLMGEEVFTVVIVILSIVFYGIPALWLAALICFTVTKIIKAAKESAEKPTDDTIVFFDLIPSAKKAEIEQNHEVLKEKSRNIFQDDRKTTYLRVQRMIPTTALNEEPEEIKCWSNNYTAEVPMTIGEEKTYFEFYIRDGVAYGKERGRDEEIKLTLNKPKAIRKIIQKDKLELVLIVTWIGRDIIC